jgi:methylmalonyl-CoA mutase
MELFTEFNKVSYEDWRKKIEIDLKGKDYQETLVWKTNEGIDVQPIYTSSTLPSHLEIPLKKSNQWKIRESIIITTFEEANKKALLALKGGANSLLFIGDISTQEEMNTLLKDIQIDILDIHFYSSKIKQIADLITLKEGSISFDFLGEQLNNEAPIQLDGLVELIDTNNSFKTITVNGALYNTENSTIIQELAFSLSHAVEYLNLLTNKGLSASAIANNMQFTFSIGTNYFFEIAKIRAARILWKLVLEQYQVKGLSMDIHSETSSIDFSEENVASNILRNTTKAMSAVVGGCDSLTVLPHDKTTSTIDFSNRIARNVQHLLKEEAFFDKVNNPADGSYYIENLTHELTEKAWILFQDMEKQGGFLPCIVNNFISQQLNSTVHA